MLVWGLLTEISTKITKIQVDVFLWSAALMVIYGFEFSNYSVGHTEPSPTSGPSQRPSGLWNVLNIFIDVNDSVLVIEGARCVGNLDVQVGDSPIDYRCIRIYNHWSAKVPEDGSDDFAVMVEVNRQFV